MKANSMDSVLAEKSRISVCTDLVGLTLFISKIPALKQVSHSRCGRSVIDPLYQTDHSKCLRMEKIARRIAQASRSRVFQQPRSDQEVLACQVVRWKQIGDDGEWVKALNAEEVAC
jgi:hypothetical protein